MSAGLAPADWPRAASAARLLSVDPRAERLHDARFADLSAFLRPGDVVVVNDAGTLPASFEARGPRGLVEVRLTGPPETGAEQRATAKAVLFGAGDWSMRTEDRPRPEPVAPGERLVFGDGELAAEIVAVSEVSSRLVELLFDHDQETLWPLLFRIGQPVQYSYLKGRLSLWQVQTTYGARPWAVEMPSAGWPLDVPLLRRLAERGVHLAAVTHAAGLSSTGDARLDAALPLPERSDVPDATVAVVEAARRKGGRIVAVGTSVVRALEDRVNDGPLRTGTGMARLRLGPRHSPRLVDGILTGLHQPGESHFELLQAFAPRPLLERALDHARARGYLGHEFGDLSLILPAA